MNKDNFEKAEQDWIPVIGGFITCFARLEDEIYTTYKHYKTLYKKEPRKYFGERIDLLEKIMNEQVLSKERDKKRLSKAMEIFRDNKNIRDLVAHNSIVLTFEANESGELTNTGFKVAKASDDAVSVSLKELQKELTKLSKARKDLEELLENFYETELNLVMENIKN
jgi:hypothetical protein